MIPTRLRFTVGISRSSSSRIFAALSFVVTPVWAGPAHWGRNQSGWDGESKGVECIDNHRTEAKKKDMPMYVGELEWRVERSVQTANSSQMGKRNSALEKWYEEIGKPKGGYTADGGIL